MAFSSISVANAFLERAKEAGKTLTNMQVQKLVYLAHGYNLALNNGPITFDSVQAWQWGPVIPPLYNKLKQFGAGEVQGPIASDCEPIPRDSKDAEVIDAVWNAFGGFGAATLSRITHEDNSPWDQTWREMPYGVISDDRIAAYYKEILATA